MVRPAHQHIVDQHQVLAFDFERQFGGPPGVQAVLGEVITVQKNVHRCPVRPAVQRGKQRLGDPDTAGADADKARLADPSLIQVAGQGGGHLEQFGNRQAVGSLSPGNTPGAILAGG